MSTRLPLNVGDVYENYDEFLRDAVPDFQVPGDDFDPAQNRGKSTEAWAAKNLYDIQIKNTEGTIHDDEFWDIANRYRQWVTGKFGENTGPKHMDTQIRITKDPTDSITPESEQDCVNAIMKQLVSPIRNRLYQDPKTKPRSALEMAGWMFPHIPLNLSTIQTNNTSEAAEKLANLRRVKGFTCHYNAERSLYWKEETPNTKPGADSESSLKQVGVRVDGIWSLRMTLEEPRPLLLDVPPVPGVPGNNENEDDKKATYLPLGERWKLENYKRSGPIIALLPMESKRYGTLDRKYMVGIAKSGLPIGEEYKLTGLTGGLRTDHNLVNMRGMIYVLHQLLHYCARYYSQVGQNSDYKSQITLRLPHGWVFDENRQLDTSRDPDGVIWWMHIDAIHTISDPERMVTFSARDMLHCCLHNALLEVQNLIHELINFYAPGALAAYAAAHLASFEAKFNPPPADDVPMSNTRHKRARSTFKPGHRRQRSGGKVEERVQNGLKAASMEMKKVDDSRPSKRPKHNP